MWISRKKWNELEKRLADLEVEVRNQPREIFELISKQMQAQMTKTIRSGPKPESQCDEPA